MKCISTEEELQMYKEHKKHETEMEIKNKRQKNERKKKNGPKKKVKQ